MHSGNGNQTKSGHVVKGGAPIDVSKLDQNRLDDFRERIRREEEERKRNQSSGQGSRRGYSHN